MANATKLCLITSCLWYAHTGSDREHLFEVGKEVNDKKGKKKMFGLLKQKTQKPRDRVEFKFKFSNFQAFQVPKGWDKLFVSIIPMETGKSIAKSGKALVRNGSCLWEETLLESAWVSQDDASKDVDEYLLKFVVAMGSVRFGTLGEATVNLAGYMNSRASVPVSLQLKKCDHGTFLQVKIQCLTPRTKPRHEQQNYTNLYIDEMNVDYNDIDNKSDVSDDSFTRSVGSSSGNCWDNAYHQEELCREASLSASASRRSVDLLEGFLRKEKLSPRSKLSCIMNDLVGTKDSTGSQNSSYGSCSSNDSSRTNHLGFSKKMSESGSHFQNPRDDFGQVSSVIVTSPLHNASSSNELLDAAEVTIELLKAEAKMWEQNNQKLMIDLEILRKELSDQSNYQADLVVELSTLHTERDGMMREIEKLKILLEDEKAKQLASEVLAVQNLDKTSRELEYEIKFQKQSNANFSSQLTKSLEANIELVSILQELEGTLEKQKNEIAYLSLSKSQFEKLQQQKWQESQVLESIIQSLERTVEEKNHEIEIEQEFKIQTLMDCEAEWRDKLQKKEKTIIDLEAKLSEALAVHKSTEMDLADGDHPIPSEEIEAVIHVIDSQNDLQTYIAGSNASHLEVLKSGLLTTPDCEVSKLKYQISYLEEELKKKEILIEGFSTNELQNQYKDNRNEREEHELQLQAFHDKACFLDGEQCKVCTKKIEQESKIDTLQHKLEPCAGKETSDTDCLTTVSTISYTCVATEMYELFSKLYEQLQLSIVEMKNQQCTLYLPAHNAQKYGSDTYDSSEVFLSEDYITQNEQVEAILNTFFQMKKLLEATITLAGDDPQCNEEVVRERVEATDEFHNEQEGYNLKVNSPYTFSQELKSLHMKLESEATYMSSEMSESILKTQNRKAYNMMNEEKVKAPQDCKWELETQVVNIRRERSLFEENTTSFLKEGNITSKCSDNLQNDMVASANKSLSKKSLEIESDQHELEVHLFELQEENVMLSERICGLEAVLRYMTDERESSRLVLQNASSQAVNLQDEVRSLEAEMEVQKVDMRQKLQVMQQRWSEIQEEFENLKIAYSELQDTNRSLVEEYSMLQKSNGDLRKQSMELHELCTVLETELKESQKFFSDTFREVENLEAKCSSILKGIIAKEQAIISELDALLLQNINHKEQLVLEESMLNQTFLDKTIEVENLQREVGHLTEQISVTRDEKERRSSEAVLEVYRLHTDKTLLDAALQEVQGKLKLYESKFDILQLEYETRVVRLMGELATSKQNQDIMFADHEKVLGLLEDVRSNEERLENIIVGLKLKLKASENERLLLAEETSCLKVQLQKTELLQDDALALKRSLSGARIENERLEASFQILSADYEELKAKRISYVQKISRMEKAMSELEDFKRSKVVLEEKVLQLEWDLAAREALHVQVAELKNEVARMKKANNECQRKLRSLKEEKVECMKTAQVPEDEPRKRTQVKHDQTNCNNASSPCFSEPKTISTPTDSMLPQTNEDANIIPSNETPNVEINQVRKYSHGQDKVGTDSFQSEVNNKQHSDTRSSQVMGVDPFPNIRNLENELTEALNSNDKHKAQIESLFSEGLQARSGEHKTLVDKDGGVTKEGCESKALC